MTLMLVFTTQQLQEGRTSLFLWQSSEEQTKNISSIFCVMGLIMGIVFIPEFTEARHRWGTLTELVCGVWFSTNWPEWLVAHVLVLWWASSHSWAPEPPMGKNFIFFIMLLPEPVHSILTARAVEVLMAEHDPGERENVLAVEMAMFGADSGSWCTAYISRW